MPYNLPAYVRLAEIDGDLVFMDARHNSYTCVTRGASAPVLAALAGETGGSPVLAELIQAGLLLDDPCGPRWAPLRLAAPRADFHDPAVADIAAGPGTWLALCAAAFAGWLKSARPRPEAWLKRARRVHRPTSPARVASLALQFDALRPFLPASGGCLPSSIMLLAFLRRHGIEAEWVFGVRTFPFDAHCWVEHEGVVLNDVLEHVAWFTPIAAC
jgi:hypothetical protein